MLPGGIIPTGLEESIFQFSVHHMPLFPNYTFRLKTCLQICPCQLSIISMLLQNILSKLHSGAYWEVVATCYSHKLKGWLTATVMQPAELMSGWPQSGHQEEVTCWATDFYSSHGKQLQWLPLLISSCPSIAYLNVVTIYCNVPGWS